jgi:hypothetical protein
MALVLLGLGCEARNGAELADNSNPAFVGRPASILAATRSMVRSSLPQRLALRTDRGESIPVVAESYDSDQDYLAVTGTAEESERSAFLLKGDDHQLYGWLVLPERDRAYEYTTSPSGEVLVKQVPVTSILPDCHDGPAQPSAAPAFEPPLAEPAGDPPHVGSYDGVTDPRKLQSRPGSSKVLFLDFSVLQLAPAELYLAWQGVSSAYSAFDVNVTSDVAVYDATTARNRGKACISNEEGRSTCYVNIFGTSRCCDIYNKGNGNYQGLTLSHELGHMMGLDHDGTSSVEYFTGFTAYKWVPLMGDCTPEASWGKQALYQWSKGEYTGANRKEDDVAIIAKNLPIRPDDIPDSTELIINGSQVSSVENRGQIAGNTDTDTFTFTIGGSGGHAKLLVERIEVLGGGMLDVDAEIQNAAGVSIVKGNDKAARTANLDVDLVAGAYKLIIKGGAEGTPENGFSSYSSLGFYGISGTITGAQAGTGGAGGTSGTGGTGGQGGTSGSVATTSSGAGGGTGNGGRSGRGDAGVSSTGMDGGVRDAGRDGAGDGALPGGSTSAGSGGRSAGGGNSSSVGGSAGSSGSSRGGSGGTSSMGGSSASGGASSSGGSASSSKTAGASSSSAGSIATAGSQASGGVSGSSAHQNSSSASTSSSSGCSCDLGRGRGRGVGGLLGCLALLLVLRRIPRRTPQK